MTFSKTTLSTMALVLMAKMRHSALHLCYTACHVYTTLHRVVTPSGIKMNVITQNVFKLTVILVYVVAPSR
jgi:hypothetical protein